MKDSTKSMYLNKLVIEDMTYNPSRQIWENGTLYHPAKQTKYKGYMVLRDRNTLVIRAYLGTPLIGKTMTWVRAR